MSRPNTRIIIRGILNRYPTLFRSMQMGVLNYSAAARYIQEEVESLLQKEVEINTIVATLTRIAKVIDEMPTIDRSEMFQRSRVYLTTGMAQLEINSTTEDQNDILENLRTLKLKDIDNLSIHQFPSCIRILCSSNDAEVICNSLGEKYPIVLNDGYALLNMKLQSSIKDESTSIAHIIDLLNRNGINIFATYSVQDDILLVVKESDISRALELLHLASRALL